MLPLDIKQSINQSIKQASKQASKQVVTVYSCFLFCVTIGSELNLYQIVSFVLDGNSYTAKFTSSKRHTLNVHVNVCDWSIQILRNR